MSGFEAHPPIMHFIPDVYKQLFYRSLFSSGIQKE
jgi:hypothetical protein